KNKITLKHGELKSHNMPPMTMVFKVKEGASLEGLQKNDAVEFTMDEKMVIQSIRKKEKAQ
ncbi:MAG: copper-binding protein, partial [Limnobacter sp.]|nr:copper-binding protein [Limnobacter sp.]